MLAIVVADDGLETLRIDGWWAEPHLFSAVTAFLVTSSPRQRFRLLPPRRVRALLCVQCAGLRRLRDGSGRCQRSFNSTLNSKKSSNRKEMADS